MNNNNSPLLSVIIPVYNIEPYLERCVKSILQQTYKNIELVLVDDGSTDFSIANCYSIIDSDIPIIVVHKTNSGVTNTRLIGVKIASGDWISFIDGDDEIEISMFQQLISNAQESDADISHCGYLTVTESGEQTYYYNSRCKEVQNRNLSLSKLINGDFEPTLCTKLFKREIVTSLIDEREMNTDIIETEDLLMNYYLFSRSKRIVYEDVCLYHYIIRSDSSTRVRDKKHIWDTIEVKEIILDSCKDTALEPVARAARLGTCMNAYNGLIFEKDSLLLEEKDKIYDLIKLYLDDAQYMPPQRAKWVKLLVKHPNIYKQIRKMYLRVR